MICIESSILIFQSIFFWNMFYFVLNQLLDQLVAVNKLLLNSLTEVLLDQQRRQASKIYLDLSYNELDVTKK